MFNNKSSQPIPFQHLMNELVLIPKSERTGDIIQSVPLIHGIKQESLHFVRLIVLSLFLSFLSISITLLVFVLGFSAERQLYITFQLSDVFSLQFQRGVDFPTFHHRNIALDSRKLLRTSTHQLLLHSRASPSVQAILRLFLITFFAFDCRKGQNKKQQRDSQQIMTELGFHVASNLALLNSIRFLVVRGNGRARSCNSTNDLVTG